MIHQLYVSIMSPFTKPILLQFCHRVVNHEDEIAHKLLGEQFQGQLEMLRTLILQALPQDNASHVSLRIAYVSSLSAVRLLVLPLNVYVVFKYLTFMIPHVIAHRTG